ncbi:hypothetical protein [Nostoc sp.]|uniref:hypothetical protein n=1 Tax=Nostoc sp. TaxID=1180 RepID=UPI002FFB4A70
MIISDLKYLENTSEEVIGGAFSSTGFAFATGTANGATITVAGVAVPQFSLVSSAQAQFATSPIVSASQAQADGSTTAV